MSDRSSDGSVVVVGGGVIGLASAHFLSLDGRKVTVIDRGRIGGGASHGNCGFVCPSHVLPLAEPGALRTALFALIRKNSPFKIRPTLDPALWSWLFHFAKRCNERDMLRSAGAIQQLLDSSLPLYEQLIDTLGLACEWQRQGLLFVYRERRAFDAYQATNELLADQFQCPAKRIEGDALLEFEPSLNPGLAGGWYYEEDAHLRPDLLISEWKLKLEERGVVFLPEHSLVDLQATTGRARGVVTSHGKLDADDVVIATGAESSRLQAMLGCRIPIQPGKGYSLTMPRPALCPGHPMIFPETRVAVTPFESALRLGSTMEFAGFDPRLRPERIQLLRDGARPYLREPATEPVSETWAGLRPMTYDGLPIIDFVPQYENVLIAAGHGMLGVSMAPATGKLVADLLARRSTFVPSAPYALNRF